MKQLLFAWLFFTAD